MLARQDNRIDELLQRWRDGDGAALELLLPLIYADLRTLAARALRGRDAGTLQTTALLHEMMLRVLQSDAAQFESREHLFNTAMLTMRRILIDRARTAAQEKRGGLWRRDDFAEAMELPIPDSTDLIALDGALNELEAMNVRMAKIVQLRYFMGLGMDEIAQALDANVRTIERDWAAARVWLKQRLGQ